MKRTGGVVNANCRKEREAAAGWKELELKWVSPEQAEQWVDKHVTDLESARKALRTLARAVMCLAKKVDLE